jgi:hypothetical protein
MMTTTIIMVAVRLVGAITCGSVMDARSCWRRSSSQGPTSVACIIRTESKMRQTVGDSQSLAILLSLIGPPARVPPPLRSVWRGRRAAPAPRGRRPTGRRPCPGVHNQNRIENARNCRRFSVTCDIIFSNQVLQPGPQLPGVPTLNAVTRTGVA